jgi:hypothetical protein
VHAVRERMTTCVLRCRHVKRFAMRNIFAARGKLFPARRVASERITSISQLKNLARPRTEYEACLSDAQSTIIF